MNDVSARDATRTLYAIEHVDEWPVWPILPMKQADPHQRHKSDGLGFMVAIESRRYEVYIGFIWQLKPKVPIGEQLDTFDKRTYNCAEAIVSDGWIVD